MLVESQMFRFVMLYFLIFVETVLRWRRGSVCFENMHLILFQLWDEKWSAWRVCQQKLCVLEENFRTRNRGLLHKLNECLAAHLLQYNTFKPAMDRQVKINYNYARLWRWLKNLAHINFAQVCEVIFNFNLNPSEWDQ